jgi:long-subunit acyl-CoA synthetase (AMP-forming)
MPMVNAQEFFARLRAQPPGEPAVQGAGSTLSYAALLDAVDRLAGELTAGRVRVLATRLPNGPAWIVADLAALRAGVVHVPLPLFFTDEQQAFVLGAAGADALLEEAAPGALSAQVLPVAGQRLALGRRVVTAAPVPGGTRKITFTSGTTATPKGVCLGDAMLGVADGLRQALAPLAVRRHLCVLPLPLLLENVAGVYAPLAAGATVVVPGADSVGLTGSSGFAPAALDAAVRRHRAESVIVLPQMLRAWSAWRSAVRAGPLPTLKFVAAGGARVGSTAIAQARLAGLPAFEGYGLSEAGSVQTLNLPHADRPGSAGKPLPHARVRIDADGQVWAAGSLMLGYLGSDGSTLPAWLATGDLGRIDADGFLHIEGRRRNVLITSYGRNVSPEWVESELQASPTIAHAVVFGDGQPALGAVLWPARAPAGDDQLAQAVAHINERLPDYARIARWVRGRSPFTAAAGMATANGRPKRDAIERLHAADLFPETPIEIPQLPEHHDVPRQPAGVDR